MEDFIVFGVLLLCGFIGFWRGYLVYFRVFSCWSRGGERESGFVLFLVFSFDLIVRGGSLYIYLINIYGWFVIY